MSDAINWAAIRPVIKTLIATISGLQTEWADQPRQYTDPTIRAQLLLSTLSPIGSGWDQVVIEQDLGQAQGSELVDRIDRIINFTLSIRCESLEQSDGKTATHYLERVRTRLNFRSSWETLNASNIAVFGDNTLQDLGASLDGRMASIAVLDLKCRVGGSENDPVRYGYLASVALVDDVS